MMACLASAWRSAYGHTLFIFFLSLCFVFFLKDQIVVLLKHLSNNLFFFFHYFPLHLIILFFPKEYSVVQLIRDAAIFNLGVSINYKDTCWWI